MDGKKEKTDAVGVRLKDAIKAARGRTSQVQLAQLVGTDQGTVSKWETGKQRPSLEDIAAIEKACGRPRGWILVKAGLVAEVRSVEEAVRMDGRLDESGQRAVLGALQGVLS